MISLDERVHMDECCDAFVVEWRWWRRGRLGAKQRWNAEAERVAAMAMDAADFAFLFCTHPTLDSDVLRLIFARLRVPLLARVACVSRTWRSVATDPALLMGCFKADWKLRDAVGMPSARKFFARGLRQFAISHPLQRWDTVDSLAVKYDVQVRNSTFSHCVPRVSSPQLCVLKRSSVFVTSHL